MSVLKVYSVAWLDADMWRSSRLAGSVRSFRVRTRPKVNIDSQPLRELSRLSWGEEDVEWSG